MTTPPNSYVSDIRFISPGSSEVEEFIDTQFNFYQSYLKRESVKYLLSPKEFENTLHEDFDISKATSEHHTIPVKCYDTFINVDELIAPLIELINKDEILTTQSCEYNSSGYCYISFTLDGFQKWCNLLLKKAIEKYGDDSYYDCKILERFSYTDNDRVMQISKYKDRSVNNIIFFTSGIHHGSTSFLFGVTWMFLQEDIESIYKEIKDLFE